MRPSRLLITTWKIIQVSGTLVLRHVVVVPSNEYVRSSRRLLEVAIPVKGVLLKFVVAIIKLARMRSIANGANGISIPRGPEPPCSYIFYVFSTDMVSTSIDIQYVSWSFDESFWIRKARMGCLFKALWWRTDDTIQAHYDNAPPRRFELWFKGFSWGRFFNIA